MHPSSRPSLGLSVSIVAHSLLIFGLLTLWRAPSLEPSNTNPNTISVQLLKPTETDEAPKLKPSLNDWLGKPKPASLPSPVKLESTLEPITIVPTNEIPNNNAITATPATSSTPDRHQNWNLSKEQASQALKQKPLAQQAQEQVGTKKKSEQEVLAHNIERSAKPSCLGDRGMGLFNAPFIMRDIANAKCKFD